MSQTSQKTAPRTFLNPTQDILPLPNLIELQLNSWQWLLDEGLKELFEEISPIEDFSGKNYALYFKDYYFEEPKLTEAEAKKKNTSFEAPLRVKIELHDKRTGEIKKQEIFLGDYPIMTERGTFIVNGVERVVVSQLVRSPGVFFTNESDSTNGYFGAKIIPYRGAWLEIETTATGVITVKIDRKRKLPITTLLRAFGYATNDEIKQLFAEVDRGEIRFIDATLEKDPTSSTAEALMEVYRRIRPGDLATVENSKSLIESIFFDFNRYDFSKVGRYKLNKRLGLDVENTQANRTLRREDLIAIIAEVIRMSNTNAPSEDIDHLANRRLKIVGELVQARFRLGLVRMERIVRDRMSVAEIETIVPGQLINVRPIVASVKEFFTSSQLSQFMEQVNPLAEIVHKRRLNALGPGGLNRERAGFEVRDVHRTHYGRICPIETPEGPNIGLVSALASYARVNEYGFIESPYIRVINSLPLAKATSETISKTIKDEAGNVVAKAGDKINAAIITRAKKVGLTELPVKARLSKDIVYLDAYEEEQQVIAQANTPLDDKGFFKQNRVSARGVGGEATEVSTDDVNYMDVSSKQIVSIPTALIPFMEHDEARRALMGANMQKQAVALVRPQAPVVGTGIEAKVAADSAQTLLAEADGVILNATPDNLKIKYTTGRTKAYALAKFVRSNNGSSIHQRVVVRVGDKVKKGDVLADGMSTDNGELALGQNVLVAFMSYEGQNFEDAIVISQRLVQDDRYSSIHIETHQIDVRDTKLGPEVMTRDIPNVSEEALKDLDDSGIVRIGAEVSAGDILVGKITPKGETDLSSEERLLRAIFGEKARDVKDTSLRLPNGAMGKVVGIKTFSREAGDDLPAGVTEQIHVAVAQMRKVQVGDKMAGRHGNKGVISKILPVEDMPYMEDGTPVDIVLNALGVGARMNIGQILETHLGWAAKTLGMTIASPVFDGVKLHQIKDLLKQAGLPEDGKAQLYDGKTGDAFSYKTTVGYKYMLKLNHMVDDKIHARSTGPYAMVTQQPLGGKAQMGGQRFGEMEVWALEAYGAAHTLQEILTIKSDDVIGRSKAYESIIKSEDIKGPRVPESFNVLVKELQSLNLAAELQGSRVTSSDRAETVDAEVVISAATRAEASDLAEEKLLIGDNSLDGDQAVVDLSGTSSEDEFQALADDKTLIDDKAQADLEISQKDEV